MHLENPIKLGIVDDHNLLQKTMKWYLSGNPKINIAVHVNSLSALLPKLPNTKVEVLLIDVLKTGADNLDELKALRAAYPDLKFLILSMNTDVELICELLDFGIHGCISREEEPEELVQAITSVAEGRIYRNKLFTDALYYNKLSDMGNNGTKYSTEPDDREKKILQLLWEEKSNKEIADEVFLSVRSVEKIRQDLKEKLGVKSTVGLFKFAIQQKIIHINSRVPLFASK